MRTELTVGKWTLEEWQPREWRAWVRLEVGALLDDGDQLHHQSGSWIDVPEHDLGSRWMGRDYRRPVPLPSLEELVEAISHRGISLKVFTHPVSGEETIILAKAYHWLRTLLPGYEEQLAKVTHVASPPDLIRAGQRLTARLAQEQPSPVPADGWRVNTNTIATVRLTEAGRARLRQNEHAWDEIAGYALPKQEVAEDGTFKIELWHLMQIFGPMMFNGSKVPFEDNVIVLPPPPQEKGGEA